jgi:hypothetical protein
MTVDFLAAILSTVFILYIIYCFILGYSGKSNVHLSDNFDIGYIKQEPRFVISAPLVKKVTCKNDSKELLEEINSLRNEIRNLKRSRQQPQQQQYESRPELAPKFHQPSPLKTETPQQCYGPFYEECVQTLVTLGYKTKVAKNEVKKFFETNKATSTEEFVLEFFKKGKK